LAASLAPSIGWLLCMRFVQGAGAGVGPTLAFAATRDRFAGTTLGRRLASLTMLLNTAPLIAPTVGAGVLLLGGWRGIFAVLALAGTALLAVALLGFAETLPSSARQTRPISAELGNALRTLRRQPEAVGAGAAYGLSAGAMFAYVAGSPMLLIGQLGASPSLYAGLFALTASGIVCGAWVSGRLLHNHELRPLAIGAPISILAPICALALFLGGEASIVTLMPCLVASTFAYGLIAPAASQLALNPLPEIAGIAAAVINTGQMACMSLSSLLVAIGVHQFHGAGMAVVMLLFALAATLRIAVIAVHRRGTRATTGS
jgi:MFS transporter, DHA1 family, multidrug resistance protein